MEIMSLRLNGVLISGDGRIHSWGRGLFGRLGTGSEGDQLSPVEVKFEVPQGSDERRTKFVGVAAGAYHNLALAGLLSMVQVPTLFYFFLFGVKV